MDPDHMQSLWIESLLPIPPSPILELFGQSIGASMEQEILYGPRLFLSILHKSTSIVCQRNNELYLRIDHRGGLRPQSRGNKPHPSPILLNQPPCVNCIDGVSSSIPRAPGRHIHSIHHQEHHLTIQAPTCGLHGALLDLSFPLWAVDRLQPTWVSLLFVAFHETVPCDKGAISQSDWRSNTWLCLVTVLPWEDASDYRLALRGCVWPVQCM